MDLLEMLAIFALGQQGDVSTSVNEHVAATDGRIIKVTSFAVLPYQKNPQKLYSTILQVLAAHTSGEKVLSVAGKQNGKPG
jgi:hypothetical protein